MSRNLQILITIAGVLLATAGCEELRIDNGLLSTTGNAFQCTTDADCVEPFSCEIESGDDVGVCASQGLGISCSQYDSDQDGYLTDAAEIPDECQGARGDCDDNDPLSNPDALELCDGLDNDCNDIEDDGIEDIPCPRQLGVCSDAEATASCVDGAFEVCGADKYGEDYEANEVSCDGQDNDCNGQVDETCCNPEEPLDAQNEQCVCSPGDVFGCSLDSGTCTRGVRVCDGSVVARNQPCMAIEPEPASSLTSCESGPSACGAEEVCVAEFIEPAESFEDGCTSGSEAACERKVCRTIASTGTTCTDGGGECAASEVCYEGECRPAAIEPASSETCNGYDDDCNGNVDDGTCGTNGCEFNMVLAQSLENPLFPNPQKRCFDRFEASRPDATADDAGTNEFYALPRAGVLPWTGVSRQEAAAACAGDAYNSNPETANVPEKRLCNPWEWSQFCGGVHGSASESDYIYGDTFTAGTCVDGRGSVTTPQPTGGQGCNSDGSGCNSCSRTIDGSASYFDATGNVWEWVRSGADVPAWLAGGSYAWPGETTLVPEGSMICGKDYGQYYDSTGAPSCATDSDCDAFERCVGSTCQLFMDQLPDPDSGDWSTYNNVGFRCCMVPN